MHARFVTIAGSALLIGSAGFAEPPKAPVRAARQDANRPAEVMLASADQVRTPVANVDQSSPAPVKRARVARVTTCRCADQTEEQH